VAVGSRGFIIAALLTAILDSVVIASEVPFINVRMAEVRLAACQTERDSNCQSGIQRVREIAPLVTKSVEYYEVRGKTLADLRLEIDAKGHGAAGTTVSLVTYRFSSRMKEDICEIQDVRANCNAKIRLPNWYDYSQAPLALQEKWKIGYQNLRQHEFGHAAICAEVAADVERTIWATPSQSDCGLVNSDARQRAEIVIRGMKARQAEYDAHSLK